MERAISPAYEVRLPSEQTIVDIFKGSWKSRLPGEVTSGTAPMFADSRPAWFASVIPGGFHGKSVLELGPFEGYQALLMEKLGAGSIDSVEGNNINFLKCLCVKELYGLRTRFHLGDILKEAQRAQRYDIVWASGVLYHMQEPVEFIDAICQRADNIFIWTHYYDASVMQSASADARSLFLSQHDRVVSRGEKQIHLHARSYKISSDYEHSIPMYWEGAPKDLTYWLELEDIHALFRQNGFDTSRVHHVGDMQGLPIVSFAAMRRG